MEGLQIVRTGLEIILQAVVNFSKCLHMEGKESDKFGVELAATALLEKRTGFGKRPGPFVDPAVQERVEHINNCHNSSVEVNISSS